MNKSEQFVCMSFLTVLLDQKSSEHVLQRIDDDRIARHLVEIATTDTRRENLVYLVITQAHQTKALTLCQFPYFYFLDFHNTRAEETATSSASPKESALAFLILLDIYFNFNLFLIKHRGVNPVLFVCC